MNPAAFTLKNNRTVLVFYFLLLGIGVQTFFTIGRLEYPEFTIRQAQIITSYPGRTTIQVEQEVTEPLEHSIRKMAEVDEVTSTSKPGLSIITVELGEQYFGLEDIWSDLRNRVNETQLPQGTSTPQVNDDFGDVAPYVYALRGDGFSFQEMQDYAEDIRDDLLAVDGAAKVELYGDQDERVYLEFSSSEFAANDVSPLQIGQILNSQNAVASSGDVLVDTQRYDLVTLGEFDSLDELANYRVTPPGQATTVRVADFFAVHRDYIDPPQSLAHYDGERVICIAVTMVDGGVVTEVGERLNDRLAEIQADLPLGLEIESMFYQPEYVSKSINDFIVNLGQAFFFVVVVMFLFAGWRIAMIVGVLVPSAILFCFTFMPAFGIALEMMSIAALIIALGLLVDNAVVVSEQILVRLSEGMDRQEAVTKSVSGLMIPLLAASGTTIAAFSPIALAPGSTSEFTYSLFAVVTLTLLSSWVLSLTIIPLFCFHFLKPLKRDTPVGRLLNLAYKPYEGLLRFTIKLRWTYPILIFVLTVVAGWGFKFVPNIFFPPNERGQFVIDFELAQGTDIIETEQQVRKLENWLLTEHKDDVRSVSAWIGEGGPRWYLALSPEPPNPNYSFLTVLTHSPMPKDVQALIEQVHEFARDELPSARVVAKALENGPPVGDPIQIEIYGDNLRTLYDLRDKIVAEVKQVDGMYDVRDDWGAWIKQITIDPDPVRSARLGLTTSDIAESLELQFSGTTVTAYREEDKSIPVVMRSREDYRQRPERLDDLPIFTNSGALPLAQVADIRIEFLPGSILRTDTTRVLTVKGRVAGRYSSEALADIQPRIAQLLESKDWPVGYHIEYAGEQAESAESSGKIGAAMPISLSILALILISQFNSMRRCLIIALTIPPMMIGVVPGLLLTGSSFGFMTMLGMIALLGIIVNNAILLIDEMDIQLKAGLEFTEAIVEAARSRLRPIIITTVTTIIGLAPLAISGGGMWSSMAFAMMFGLGFATLLTLLLCPVLFYLFFRKKYEKAEA